jgi:hypothetical protein
MLNRKRLIRAAAVMLTVGGLVAWDLHTNLATTLFVGPAASQDGGLRPDSGPLQVEGLPLLRPGTLTLGTGRATVAVAASIDEELPEPAPINAELSIDQVDAVVRRALDLDRSGRSLRDVIDADDWVLIKVNSVTNRGRLDQRDRGAGFYYGGFEHPGQITDLRVVRSVIHYLIEHVGPRRITIAEGGAESPRKGEVGFPSGLEDDAWSARYPQFGGLSYTGLLQEFRDLGVPTLVDTSDLNYAPWRRDPIPGGAIQRLGVTRSTYDGAQFGFHVDGSGSFRPEGFYMPEPFLDADKVISIPAMKTTIYGTTLAIKNFVGTLASGAYGDGTSKSQHYQNNPEHGYVDLMSYNVPVYSVIEGFWGTEGDGPQWGQNVQHNVVVAGADPVATEAIANVTMGFNPLDLEALYLAAAKGFGTLDRGNITVVGRPPETVVHDFVKSRGGGMNGFFYGRGIRRWLVAGPFPGNTVANEHLPNEADLRPMAGAPAGDGTWVRAEHLGYSAERLNLGEIVGTEAQRSSYAFTLVRSQRAQEGFLWLGFDEHAKVWLNGEVVFEKPSRTVFSLAGERVPIRLREGENRLLIKVGNFAGDTFLAAHVVDRDGDRLPGIDFVLPGDAPTAVTDVSTEAAPENVALLPNYPNPFNPATHVRYQLDEAAQVQLAVFSVTGQRVRELVVGHSPAGVHEVIWDGRDDAGHSVASGVYVARLLAEPAGSGPLIEQARRMTLLR